MHPRISINTLCLIAGRFNQHVDQVARLGAKAIGPGLEEVVEFGPVEADRLLRDAQLSVSTLTHRAFGYATTEEAAAASQRLEATLAIAETIGAETVTLTTGGRGRWRWNDAADRFAEAIAPFAARARNAGVKLALEPTSHLFADASIAHRLSDTVALAETAGIDLSVDIFACWFDSDIEQAIAKAGPHIALVQVSDYILGDRGLPCRAAPGDGAIPLQRLIPVIGATGYRGYYDLEILGPRIETEGFNAVLRRGAAFLEPLVCMAEAAIYAPSARARSQAPASASASAASGIAPAPPR